MKNFGNILKKTVILMADRYGKLVNLGHQEARDKTWWILFKNRRLKTLSMRRRLNAGKVCSPYVIVDWRFLWKTLCVPARGLCKLELATKNFLPLSLSGNDTVKRGHNSLINRRRRLKHQQMKWAAMCITTFFVSVKQLRRTKKRPSRTPAGWKELAKTTGVPRVRQWRVTRNPSHLNGVSVAWLPSKTLVFSSDEDIIHEPILVVQDEVELDFLEKEHRGEIYAMWKRLGFVFSVSHTKQTWHVPIKSQNKAEHFETIQFWTRVHVMCSFR